MSKKIGVHRFIIDNYELYLTTYNIGITVELAGAKWFHMPASILLTNVYYISLISFVARPLVF